MKWIKVTERLPEPGERVLFVTKGGFVGEGYLSSKLTWHRYDAWSIACHLGEVIAWMPMPEYGEDEG